MKTRLQKSLFFAVLSLGVAAVVLFLAGTIAGGVVSKIYWDRVNEFQASFQSVTRTFSASAPLGTTASAVEAFLRRLPQEGKDSSNFVFVDKSGTILYRLNDKYLPAGETTLNLAWKNVTGVSIAPDGSKQWFTVGMDGVGDGWTGGGPTWVGPYFERTAAVEEIDQLLDMMSVDGGPRAIEATIESARDGAGYLIWWRGAGVSEAVYRSFGRDGASIWDRLIYAGGILFLAYWALTPAWVFVDARRRRSQPLPWALLVLLTNIVGLVVYWIVHAQAKAAPAKACPACGQAVQEEYPYCPWCGVPLRKRCAACGRALEAEWVACPWCGQGLELPEKAEEPPDRDDE